MNEPYRTTLDNLNQGIAYLVRCPDGIRRRLWGYNPATGDLFVSGWPGNVWMDCSDGTLRAEFE